MSARYGPKVVLAAAALLVSPVPLLASAAAFGGPPPGINTDPAKTKARVQQLLEACLTTPINCPDDEIERYRDILRDLGTGSQTTGA